MAAIKPAGYQQNLQTHTALIDRLSSQGAVLLPDTVGGLRPVGGIRAPGDLTLTAVGGMVVRLGPGMAYVPQGQSAVGGAYNVPNDGNMDFTVPAANASLARRDLIVARVLDSFYAGTQNDDDFIYLTGTAATTPVDPALPAGASYTVLHRITVPAAAAAIVVGNLTQIAYPAPHIGGLMPVSPTDTALPLYDGQTRWHPTFGIQIGVGGAWTQSGAIPSAVTDLGPLLNASLYRTDPTFPLRALAYPGRVVLSGAITNNVTPFSAGAGAAFGIFAAGQALPTGLRPAFTKRIPSASLTGTTYTTAIIVITAAGDIQYVSQGALTAGFQIHLDGVSWPLGY